MSQVRVMGAENAEKVVSRVPGEVSSERVQRALAMAAGDVLQRSPLSPEERMAVAGAMSKLAGDFAELAKKAWGS